MTRLCAVWESLAHEFPVHPKDAEVVRGQIFERIRMTARRGIARLGDANRAELPQISRLPQSLTIWRMGLDEVRVGVDFAIQPEMHEGGDSPLGSFRRRSSSISCRKCGRA